MEQGIRFAVITLPHHFGIQWNSSQKGYAHVVGGRFSPAQSKDFDVLVAMGAIQAAHVLHDTDNRQFAVPGKGHRLPGVEQRHFLRSRNDHAPGHLPDQVDRRDRLVSGSRRQIHDKKIQILPFDAAE